MEIEKHQCPQCSCEFEWKFQTEHHVQREHTLVHVSELFHAIRQPEQFSCIYCSFMTCYNYCDLYEHYKQQHHGRTDENNMQQSSFCDEEADSSYLCNLCRYKSDSSLCLVKHNNNSCETMATPSTGDNPDNETSSPNSNVVVVGNQTKDLHCAKCSYKTKWRNSLKCHMLKHAASEDIDWLQCSKCSYKAKRKTHLKTHMQTHTSSEDIVWFQCSKCSYRAKQKINLKNHMLTHSSSEDIDWRRCGKCSFKTKWKESLKKHMMTHAGVEDIDWFRCAECSYKSKQKSNLNSHMLIHASVEDIDWFRCAKCSYKSKWKDSLRTHMITHVSIEDIAWFKCAKCPFKSKRKTLLNKHNMQIHTSSEDIG